MTALLSLWTGGDTGAATLLADGRVPPEVNAVALFASADAPDDARLELQGEEITLLPRRVVTMATGARTWVLTRAELASSLRWRAALTRDDEVLATVDLDLDEVPRLSELAVVGRLRSGEVRLLDKVTAGELVALSISAEPESSAESYQHLSLHVEDPLGRSWHERVEYLDLSELADDDEDPPPPLVTAVIHAAPFTEGDWTLSLVHRGRTLVRRLRLHLSPSPLTVRAATLLELGPTGATPVGTSVEPARLQRRLVFAYALDGLRPGRRGRVELTLRDGAGALLGAWTHEVDRGDAAAMERVWFPLAPGLLAGARDAIEAQLKLEGGEAHVLRVSLVSSPFRSDGTVIDAAASAAAPVAEGFGLAQAFFGLVRRRRRRRRAPAPPPETPTIDDDDLPF